MTQEDKDLLLRDLCARLPYGVKGVEANTLCSLNTVTRFKSIVKNIEYKIEHLGFKPYLFPLSSMTEEQKKFFKDRPIFLDSENELVVKEDFFGNSRFTMLEDWVEVVLWLVKNHFDYRGLIPMGLAIDATNLNVY